jgi:molybdopterin-guanine dinucleotide biosynthesis protein A
MPFITAEFLRWFLAKVAAEEVRPIFVQTRGRAGFPFLLPRESLPDVTRQIQLSRYSLQALAELLQAKLIRPSPTFLSQLRNVNTASEWKAAQRSWKKQWKGAILPG